MLGLEVVYLIAANVFLNTGIGPRAVNRKPQQWSLAWDNGWSLIPSRFYLNGAVFERYGRRLDVHAKARKIGFRVALLPLASRRFVAKSVPIEGLTLALERHSDEVAGDRAEAPDRASRAAARPGWRIELSGVEVDGIESFRFDDFETSGGEGRFSGDFKARVRGQMELPRSTLTWSDAALRQDGEVLAEPLTVTFDGRLSPLDPGRQAGWAVIDHLDGQLEVLGGVSRLAILRRFFANAKWIEALDGHGRLSVKLLLEEGWIKPGSELVADAESLRLDFLGYATEGSGRVRGTVNDATGEPDEPGPVRMEVTFDDFTVRRKPSPEPNVRGQGFSLVATTWDPDVRQGLGDLEVTIDMPRAEVPDIGVYSAYLPPGLGVAVESGRGVASLHLEGSAKEESVSGQLTLDAEKVAGQFQDLSFETGLKVRTRISGGDLDDFRLEIEGTRMELTDGVFQDRRNTREEGWWMTVDVPRGTAHLGGETPRLEADVELAMRDTRVIIAMFAELKSWLQRFEKILTVKDVTGSGRVGMRGQHLSLRDLEIKGRKLHGRAELELSDAERQGILYVRFHGFTVGLERQGDEKDWKLVKVKPWFERRVAESWSR